MFQNVMNYKPNEQDYRTWLVINPATWLMPMMLALLILGIAVHAAVFSIAPAGMLFVNDAAPAAAAPVAVEAPAPAAQ